MGMSPSEKSKLFRDVRDMKSAIDDVNNHQDKEIMAINSRLDAIITRLANFITEFNGKLADVAIKVSELSNDVKYVAESMKDSADGPAKTTNKAKKA